MKGCFFGQDFFSCSYGTAQDKNGNRNRIDRTGSLPDEKRKESCCFFFFPIVTTLDSSVCVCVCVCVFGILKRHYFIAHDWS